MAGGKKRWRRWGKREEFSVPQNDFSEWYEECRGEEEEEEAVSSVKSVLFDEFLKSTSGFRKNFQMLFVLKGDGKMKGGEGNGGW